MKITITIDATADEVREAFGIPNMKDMQGEVLERLIQKVRNEDMDTGSLLGLLDPNKSFLQGKKFLESALETLASSTRSSE
ncbi:MAG: hypothetical protein ISS63_13500 [Desulfobacteraceae bacterium]|nr:hypothetical protein [Desulfobacteraceae bacterium]